MNTLTFIKKIPIFKTKQISKKFSYFALFTNIFIDKFQVSFMFYFIILACIIYLCIQKFYGGLEFFVIEKFNEHRARQRGQSVPLSVPSEPSPVESSNSNDM